MSKIWGIPCPYKLWAKTTFIDNMLLNGNLNGLYLPIETRYMYRVAQKTGPFLEDCNSRIC